MDILVYFDLKIEIFAKFGTLGQKASSAFLTVDWHFDFMTINAKNATLHQYLEQSGKSLCRTMSETIEKYWPNAKVKFI